MRRASIAVLVLTFLALVAGTLAVPARSSGLVWTITPTVVQNSTPRSESVDAEAGAEDEPQASVLEELEDESFDATRPATYTFATQVQGAVALNLGQPNLHWQPLWIVLWPKEPEVGFGDHTSRPMPFASLTQDWTVDKQAWALQLGLILALGGLLFLFLRIAAARREANRDLTALAAR